MGTVFYFFGISLFILLSIMLCFVILIQESKSTGLGASFGGEASDSIFGTSTADVLKQFTAYLAAAFFVGCIILSIWTTTLNRAKAPQVDPFRTEIQK